MNMNTNEMLERWQKTVKERDAKIDAWLKELIGALPCEWHPGKERVLDRDASGTASLHAGKAVGVYLTCPLCQDETDFRVVTERMRKAGVPGKLLHCSLANWTADNDATAATLEQVRGFAARPGGRFLLLFGAVGSGKSHLAAGVLRARMGGVWFTQSGLLRRLRDSYEDDEVRNPINECQDARLLVLDDMATCSGGKDEWPMLYDIMSYRAEDGKRPTVVTSNMASADLFTMFDKRLTDRIRSCDPLVVVLTGASHRGERPVAVPAEAWSVGGGRWDRERGPRREEFAGDASGADLWRSLVEAWETWRNKSTP